MILGSVGISTALLASEPNTQSNFKAELAKALRRGELDLIAQAYDTTHRDPKLRGAVIDFGANLAPRARQDVMTAAELGALTSGQSMTLASNAAQVLASRATASAVAPISSQNIGSASNLSPNLPVPQPSVYDQTWHLDMIGAQGAYNRGFTGSGVSVAVGDSGFDTSNAALVNKLNIALGRNYLVSRGGTYNPTELTPQVGPVADQHGSHVAGIIAAEKFDNVDMHGVAYDATVIPIRTIIANQAPYGYAAGINGSAAPLNYFASLRDVMVYNASYGPSAPEGTQPQTAWLYTLPNGLPEANAVLNVLQAGKIIVAATGNDRGSDPIAARNPSGMALYPYIQPAHAKSGVYEDYNLGVDLSTYQHQNGLIIGVMSVGSFKEAASYSNLCGVTASWCVAAPGGNAGDPSLIYGPAVYSTIPDNTYGFLQGTSMAAPAVSGALAVLIQANPSYNAQDLAHLLFSTTEDLGPPGVDAIFGHGLIRLDRATDGPTTLAANAIESVAFGTTTYWSRLLQTQGDFIKAGEGILTISGRTNAGGNVLAALGTLAVDGTLSMTAGNRLSVAAPATLAGFGSVIGDTTIAGTLSPGKMANIGDLVASGWALPGTTLQGNSVGALTFNGNVTLTATANTRIDIDGTLIVPGGPQTFDRIYVTGAGNVFYAAGTLTPVLRGSVGTVSNYTPAIGTDFAFVNATDGARTAGTFQTLVQPTAGLPDNGRFDLIYQPTTITLAVTPASFANLAAGDQLGSNEQTIARILDSERAAPGAMPTAAEKALYDALYNLDSQTQFDQALSQLAGPGQPAISSASLQAFSGFLGAIGDRQDTLGFGGEQSQNGAVPSFALSYAGRGMMSAETNSAMSAFASIAQTPRAQDSWAMWGQGFGRSSRIGDSGEFAGSKAVSAGFTLGADRWFSNNLLAGAAFGYAHTSATSTDIRGNSDTYAGAAYASWTPGAAVIDVRVAAGPSQMSTTRQIVLAPTGLQGSTNGVGVGTTLEAGYHFALTADVVLKPFAGISWQGFRRDGYSESQLPIGLVYSAQTYDKLTTTAGVALSAPLRTLDGTTLMPEVKLGWGYDLRDTTLVSQAALLDEAFLVSAAQPGRNAALVGAKLSGWRTESFRIFTAYNGEYRSNAVSHQLSAGARFTW